MLNSAESFTMVFSKSPTVPKCKIVVYGKFLEHEKSFIYLVQLSHRREDAKKK